MIWVNVELGRKMGLVLAFRNCFIGPSYCLKVSRIYWIVTWIVQNLLRVTTQPLFFYIGT